MNLKELSFTNDWTLFLDRDGVINERIPGGYVTQWKEFKFLEGVLEAFSILTAVFGRIIVVSNQQGIGKGLMTTQELIEVDRKMRESVSQAGGWIDASYYSPHLEKDNHPDRKPGTGMGMKAKGDFPEIDFSRSVMVGDTKSDMKFGKNLGMIRIFIGNKENAGAVEADLYFGSLLSFAKSIHREIN